jgi:hypothetical protein
MTEKNNKELGLLQEAKEEGAISEGSRKILELASGRSYNPKLLLPGVSPKDYQGDWVLLATLFVDDSGSMGSNAETVRIGQNAVIDALQDSAYPESVLVRTELLNKGPLSRYNTVKDAIRLDRQNYRTGSGTPLYDRTAEILSGIQISTQEFSNDWKTVRTATLITTDGIDENSKGTTEQMINQVVTDMKRTGIHLIAGMPIGKERHVVDTLLEMGIDEKWILPPGSTPDEIRGAFGLFAKAAVKALDLNKFSALNAGGFKQLNAGN